MGGVGGGGLGGGFMGESPARGKIPNRHITPYDPLFEPYSALDRPLKPTS